MGTETQFIAFTAIPWLDAILNLMGAWGYPIAFGGATFENTFLVGSFMPGETIVMAAAFLASVPKATLNIPAVWTVSVLGTMAGSNLSYYIGHRGGRPLLDAIVRRFPKLQRGIHDAEEYFEIHGAKTVFIARFTAGFKNFVPTLAGVTRMNLSVFQMYTFLSAIVYTTGLMIIGYLFGSNLPAFMEWADRAGVWLLVALAVVIAAYVAFRLWRRSGIEEQVEAHENEVAAERADAADVAEPPAPTDGDAS